MDTKKIIIYSAAGAGAALLGYGIYRALNRRGSTKLKGEPQLTRLDNPVSAASGGGVGSPMKHPALAVIHDENGDYVRFGLNYTPQADPEQSDQMSVEDYERLQDVGLIPEGFPMDRIVSVPSHNGRNWFFVGYSEPFSMSTNRDNLTVIEPMWAVSYGLDFDDTSTPPENFPDEDEFYNVALHILYAEWLLTNRGVDGCHRGQTLSACNVERGAVLNLILQRLHMKQSRIDGNLSYESNIYGPGIRWNASTQFMSSYEGAVPAQAKKRFDEFYSTSFWQMPQYSGNAVGFIHPYGMSKGGANPPWTKKTEPLDTNFGPYLASHVVKLGNAVFSDIRKTFR